jgi:hypothetical protein
MSKIKRAAARAAAGAVGEVAGRVAEAARTGDLGSIGRVLKSTQLWSAAGIAALQGFGVFGLLDPEAVSAGTTVLLAPLITERLKKGF